MSALPPKRPLAALQRTVAKGQNPPPAPQQFRVALVESCQRDVPKSRLIAIGGKGAVGGRPNFIIHTLSVVVRIARRHWEDHETSP